MLYLENSAHDLERADGDLEAARRIRRPASCRSGRIVKTGLVESDSDHRLIDKYPAQSDSRSDQRTDSGFDLDPFYCDERRARCGRSGRDTGSGRTGSPDHQISRLDRERNQINRETADLDLAIEVVTGLVLGKPRRPAGESIALQNHENSDHEQREHHG